MQFRHPQSLRRSIRRFILPLLKACFKLNQSSTVWNGAETGGHFEREKCKRNSIFVLNFESKVSKENGVFKCVSTFFSILSQNFFEIFRKFNNQLPVMKVFSTVWNGRETGGLSERENCNRNSKFLKL